MDNDRFPSIMPSYEMYSYVKVIKETTVTFGSLCTTTKEIIPIGTLCQVVGFKKFLTKDNTSGYLIRIKPIICSDMLGSAWYQEDEIELVKDLLISKPENVLQDAAQWNDNIYKSQHLIKNIEYLIEKENQNEYYD